MHARRSAAPALVILAAVLANCSDGPVGPGTVPPPRLDVTAGAGADASAACSPIQDVALLAGQDLPVGAVHIANDESTLYVTVETSGGWTLDKTQLFAGTSSADIPLSHGGNPVPGQFLYSVDHAAGTTSYTYGVPLPGLDPDGNVAVALHADVYLGDEHEGAWGDGDAIASGGSWGTYMTYAPVRCVSAFVTPEDGGELTLGDFSFSVPAGAVSEGVWIRITPVPLSELDLPPGGFTVDGDPALTSADVAAPAPLSTSPAPTGPDASSSSAGVTGSASGTTTSPSLASLSTTHTSLLTPIPGTAYRLEPEGLVFDPDAQPTITIPYQSADVPERKEPYLGVFIIDGVFPRLPSVVDQDVRTVSAKVPHFSFAFLGVPYLADLETTELTQSVETARVEAPIDYSATVVNHGPDPTTGGRYTYVAYGDVTVGDVYGSCEEVEPIFGDAAVACDIAPLDPDGTDGIETFRLIPHSAGTVTVWATASYPVGAVDPVDDNDRLTATTTVLADQDVDYAITSFAPSDDPALPYSPLTYTGQVTLQDGPVGGVSGGEYQLVVVGQLAVLSTSDPACSVLGQTVPARQIVTCPLGDMTTGGSRTLDVVVEPHAAPATLTATASVSAPFGHTDLNPADNTSETTTTVRAVTADLRPTTISDSPDPVDPGGTVAYRFYVLSGGTDDAVPHVPVQFRVTGDASLVSMPSVPGVTCTDLSDANPTPAVQVNCDIDQLEPGIASPPLDFAVRAASGPSLEAEAEVYVPDYAIDSDPSNNMQREGTDVITTPASPASLYVSDFSGQNVALVDRTAGAVRGLIDLGTKPGAIRLAPGGSELWTVESLVDRVALISTATGSVDGSIGFTLIPVDVAFSSDGGTAYVALSGTPGALAVVDVASRAVTATITTGMVDHPHEVALGPADGTAYVVGDFGVSVVDLGTGSVTKTITLPGYGQTVATSPDRSSVYVLERVLSSPSSETYALLDEIDAATNELVGSIRLDLGALDVVLSPDGGTAYLTDVNDLLLVVDLATGTVTTRAMPASSRPYGIAMEPDGSAVWVTLWDAGSIVRVDLSTLAVSPQISTGANPFGIAIP